MSRKSAFIKEYTNAFNQARIGKKTTCARQLRVMRSIVDDLYILPQLPSSFAQLKKVDVKQLVDYWQECENSHSTMINKLGVLRLLARQIKIVEPIPSNADLGLKRQRCYRPIDGVNLASVYYGMENSIARILFGITLYFGMTFNEAAHCIPLYHINDKDIFLTRDMTYNNQERQIPITMPEQQHLIAELTKRLEPEQSLAKRYRYRVLSALYHAELVIQQLPHVQYRYYYACLRRQQLIKQYNHRQYADILKQELGLKSDSQLWHYLRVNTVLPPTHNMQCGQHEQDKS